MVFISFQHRTYAHIFDAAKQDWFSVASILEHLICTLKIQIANINTMLPLWKSLVITHGHK